MPEEKRIKLLEIEIFDHLTVCKQIINIKLNYSY